MRRFLLFLAFMGLTMQVKSIDVIGNVVGADDHQPIVGAYLLLQKTDSTLVAQTSSDAKGAFKLSAPNADDYVLVITSVGFAKQKIVLNNLQKKIDLGTIEMLVESVELGEVTVQAENIVKVDRQIYFPPSVAVENSFNGLELLSKLRLPGLLVNIGDNSITAIDNRSLQIRINGAEVEMSDVMALNPDRIQKVEFIDMPGVRYGDVGRVIDIITKRVESGFSTSGMLRTAVTAPNVSSQVNFKFNHKLSEFGLSYNYNYSYYKDRCQNNSLEIKLPDKVLILNRVGFNAPTKSLGHNLTLTYNWRNDQGTMFNAVLRNQWNLPQLRVKQFVTDQLNNESYNYYLHTKDHSYTPSLNLYFEHPINEKQTIIANLVGTYINTDYQRENKEWSENGDIQRDLSYTTKGDKQTYQGELLYENKFNQQAHLTVGVNYKWSKAKNVYSESLTNKMFTSDLYGYAQLQGSIKKFVYQVGVGFTHQTFEEGDYKYHKSLFRPQMTLSYSPLKNLDIRYNVRMEPGLSSLSQTSEYEQWLNYYEMDKGNPDLKPFQVYVNMLTLDWRIKRLSIDLSFYYQFNNNYVFNTIYRRNDGNHYYIEYHKENQKDYQHIQPRLFLTYEAIKNHLNITVFGVINRYLNHGNSYTRCLTNPMWGAQLQGNYKNWSLSASYLSKGKMQSAELTNITASSSNLSLRYRYKLWQFGMDVQNIFQPNGSPYRDETISKYVHKLSEIVTRSTGNLILFSISWNFDSGRKYRLGNKKTSNNADSDSGVMK